MRKKSSSFSKQWLIPAVAGGAITDDNFLKNTNLNEINARGETENKTNAEKLLEFIENLKISKAAERAFEISNSVVKKR